MQVFEGQDYSKSRQSKDSGLASALPIFAFDIGKRERKPTQTNLNERDLLKKAMDHEPRKRGSKLPKHLRLPRIDDQWMFFNRERLHEIHAIEEVGTRHTHSLTQSLTHSLTHLLIHSLLTSA